MGKEHDLLQAVKEQDLHAVHRILSKSRSKAKLIGSSKRINVNLQDQDGMAALHQAALVGNTNIMQALLENGIMVDIKDNKGMRPLHYAAWQGKEAPVNLLLQWGSSANEPAKDGETPLHLACQHGHYDVVNLLLQHKGDPTIYNRNYKTPLDLACEFGRYQVVELLLQSNLCGRLLYHCENDLADNHRTTCLHLAAKNGHGNIIKLLLQVGVDINRQTHQGTCLHEAALYGKTEVVKLLLDCGIDVNRPNSYDQTALDIVNQFTASRAAKELKQLLKDLDQQINGESEVYNASYNVIARATKDHYHIYDQSALAFKEGDYISVLEQRSDGIWKGQIIHESGHLSRPGYFPSSAVVLVDKQALSAVGVSLPGMTSARRVMAPQVPDLLNPSLPPVGGDRSPYNSVGMDESFPPPPSPLVKPKGSPSRDSDRDSGISPQQHYPPHGFPGQGYYQQPSPTSPEQPDWFARHVVDSDIRSHSPNRDSPGSSNRNSAASSGSGGYLPAQGYVNQTSQHRLSGQSYESGVSGVSAVSSSRQSYHSNSSSSLGSLDRLEESGYSSTVNVHELFQQGLAQDTEVLRCWLADLHYEEYYSLFVQAGYDMPTISRMTPEDLTAIGITKPAHRKRLKAEISKLQIHDGIPDFKPQDVAEWLHLLNLDTYFECITTQGYGQIDDVTEITWEDLEEIGIKKLGHQKKIMLAVERLKRIESGCRRLSTLERKSSVEMLEPPSSYPTPVWLKDRSGAVPEVPALSPKPKRSPSGDDISAPELRTFQQFPRAEDSGAFQPDVVAIQVKRTGSRSNSIDESQREVIYQSFQGPFPDLPRGQLGAEGDQAMERPADEMDGSSTLRRPSAKVSPRIAPKPKPVAMIQAKTKRGSRDFSSLESQKLNSPGDRVLHSPGYSGTLGRKSSFSKSEPIYDMPGELTIKIPSSGTPEKQSPSNLYAVSPVGKGGKKAPPPPPKRTNSIKSDINLMHHKTLKKVEPPTVPTPAPAVAMQIPGSPGKQPSVPRAESQESIAESLPAPPLDYSPPQTDDFPPPPPPISAPSPLPLDLGPSEAPNPLTEAIQELERQAQSPCSTLKKPKNKVKVDRGWKSDSDSDSGDSGFGAKRNDSMASIASTESNTLPFANENVGTIKQRAPAAKPTILSVGGEEGADREVDPTLFEDGMSTIRRQPKAEGATAHPMAEVPPQPRGAECRKVPPPTPKRRDSIKSQQDTESNSLEGSPKKGNNNETTDVLNDIGNMLQDLTDELDAMLEFEL